MNKAKDAVVDVMDSPEYGAVLICKDLELADQFEDFLTEECFVLFQIKPDPDVVSFYFGQASSVSRVKELYQRFLSGNAEC